VANRLKMATIEAIRGLLKRGWSQRRIARELGIDRETVARYAGPGGPQAAKPAISTAGRASQCSPIGRWSKTNWRLVSRRNGSGRIWSASTSSRGQLRKRQTLRPPSPGRPRASLPTPRIPAGRRGPGGLWPRRLDRRGQREAAPAPRVAGGAELFPPRLQRGGVAAGHRESPALPRARLPLLRRGPG
jgi:hypothetical protein